MKKIALAVAIAAASSTANALVVNTTNDGTLLTNTILGSGITVDAGSIAYTGSNVAAGTFSDGTSTIGIESGILLTSGKASDAVGPNTSDGLSYDNGAGGNAALTALSGFPTHNATTLSFDFTTTGGDLYFNYVFASEEYNEYVNSQYNDVFALFLDGVNIALAPNGDAVGINTVNCGKPYGSADANCSSFVNNDPSDGGPYYNIQYDGFTTILQAVALDLAAGVHTMTFAIADASDTALESTVFVQAGTFSDTPTDPTGVPEPTTLALLGLGLAGLSMSRRRK